MTAEELISFEKDIAREFEAGNIKAPVHLHGGNERELIEIFENIKPEDWVFSTHRSHYHALLKGVPPEQVKAEIMAGRSISLQFPEYHFFPSAIVGAVCPIPFGVPMSGMKTWCFIGDMRPETGIFHECLKYATGHNLPITYVVESNGLSVETPTEKVWRYSYQRTFPHQGSGTFVLF